MDRCFHNVIYGFKLFRPKSGLCLLGYILECRYWNKLCMRWCVVCTSPQEQKVSVLSSSSRFIRLSFVRSIPVLSLSNVRQTSHPLFWPSRSDWFGTHPEKLFIWFLFIWSFFLPISGYVDENIINNSYQLTSYNGFTCMATPSYIIVRPNGPKTLK